MEKKRADAFSRITLVIPGGAVLYPGRTITGRGLAMTDRMQVLSREEINLIHDASMEILAETGVKFASQEALALFHQHGFKVANPRVHMTEKEVQRALETVPSRFVVHARNPQHNVAIGEDDFVFLPTAGAPNVSDADGVRRPATLADYATACKLVQTSDQLDMNGYLTVQPTDVSSRTAHLDMLYANLTLCDKAFLAGSNFLWQGMGWIPIQ